MSHLVFPVVVYIFGNHGPRDSFKGQAWLCEGFDRREETIYSRSFLYLMTFVSFFVSMDFHAFITCLVEKYIHLII